MIQLFFSFITIFSTLLFAQETYQVSKRDIAFYLYEQGAVQATQKKTILSPVDGEIIWVAEEGSKAKKGDKIVQFDAQLFTAELNVIQSETQKRKVALEKMKQELENQKKSLTKQIKKREIELQIVRIEIQQAQIPKSKKQMEILKLQIEKARVNLRHAEEEYERYRALRIQEAVSVQFFQDKKQALEKSSNDLARAKAIHQNAQKGVNKRRLEILKVREKNIEAIIEQDKKNFHESIEVLKKRVLIEKTKLKQTLAKEKKLQQKIALTTITAPVSGMIIYPRIWKGKEKSTGSIAVGETRWENAKLLQIANISSLCVKLSINEANISQIKKGNPAKISLVAYPKQTYQGKVISWEMAAHDKNAQIGSLAMEKYGKADVSVVEITVNITSPTNNYIRPGLTARLAIEIKKKLDVIAIPQKFLFWEKQTPYVWKSGQNTKVKQKVQLGISNEHYVEITKGLTIKDKIIVK